MKLLWGLRKFPTTTQLRFCLPWAEASQILKLAPVPINSAKLLAVFEKSAHGSGAIVSFSGIVRPKNKNGEQVTSLYLEAYSPLTESGIKDAIREAQSRWPIDGVTVEHRIGEIKPRETIVFVATASAHRRAAFEAIDFIMDYLKTEAVFWKKETTEKGSVWIEPRTDDYIDASRWKTC